MSKTQSVFDTQYLIALRLGRQDAENLLYATFHSKLKRVLRTRLHSSDAAEDACQETLLRVFTYFRSGKTLRSAASLPRFIESVGRNVALERVRTEARHPPLPETLPETADPAGTPEDSLLVQERRRLIHGALCTVSDADRRLLRGLLLEEKRRDAVCAEFRVNRDYLRLLVFRARARCRQVLSSAGLTLRS